MYWEHDTHGIYRTPPMQAALHLYLPHVVEVCEPPHQEPSSHYPNESRQSPTVHKRKHTQHLW